MPLHFTEEEYKAGTVDDKLINMMRDSDIIEQEVTDYLGYYLDFSSLGANNIFMSAMSVTDGVISGTVTSDDVNGDELSANATLTYYGQKFRVFDQTLVGDALSFDFAIDVSSGHGRAVYASHGYGDYYMKVDDGELAYDSERELDMHFGPNLVAAIVKEHTGLSLSDIREDAWDIEEMLIEYFTGYDSDSIVLTRREPNDNGETEIVIDEVYRPDQFRAEYDFSTDLNKVESFDIDIDTIASFVNWDNYEPLA